MELSDASWQDFFCEVESVLVEELEDSGKLAIYIVIGKSSTDDVDKVKFFEDILLPALCPEEDDSWLDRGTSDLVPANELLMTQVFDTYKLSLDDMSGDDDDTSSF